MAARCPTCEGAEESSAPQAGAKLVGHKHAPAAQGKERKGVAKGVQTERGRQTFDTNSNRFLSYDALNRTTNIGGCGRDDEIQDDEIHLRRGRQSGYRKWPL